MIVLGIDPSLTSTGLALLDTDGRWDTDRVRTPPARSVPMQAARMDVIVHRVLETACYAADGMEPAQLVVIEGMSLGSHNAFARDIAGLWWSIVRTLTAEGFEIVVVAPATRAKYATGDGRASKREVLAAVRDTYPDAEVPVDDVADAVALAALGARMKQSPVERIARPWVEEIARQVAEREQEQNDG